MALLQILIGVIGAIPIEVIVLPLIISFILIDIALGEVTQHLTGLLVELAVQRIGLTTLRREVGTTNRSNMIVRTIWRTTCDLDILPVDVQDGGERGAQVFASVAVPPRTSSCSDPIQPVLPPVWKPQKTRALSERTPPAGTEKPLGEKSLEKYV